MSSNQVKGIVSGQELMSKLPNEWGYNIYVNRLK